MDFPSIKNVFKVITDSLSIGVIDNKKEHTIIAPKSPMQPQPQQPQPQQPQPQQPQPQQPQQPQPQQPQQPQPHSRPPFNPHRYKWVDEEVKNVCNLEIYNDEFWFTSKLEIIKCLDTVFNTYFARSSDTCLNVFETLRGKPLPIEISVGTVGTDGKTYLISYFKLKDWYSN
jgi:hypothetical protein